MRALVCRAGFMLLLAGCLGVGLIGCTFPEPDLNWSKPDRGRGSAIAQCYKTLAEPDCETELQPDDAYRAVGWYDGGPTVAETPGAQ